MMRASLSHDRFSACGRSGLVSTTAGARVTSARLARSLTCRRCNPFASRIYTPCGSFGERAGIREPTYNFREGFLKRRVDLRTLSSIRVTVIYTVIGRMASARMTRSPPGLDLVGRGGRQVTGLQREQWRYYLRL
jgi:hypothetical protein